MFPDRKRALMMLDAELTPSAWTFSEWLQPMNFPPRIVMSESLIE